ncbi:HpcH/HpaI aldolase/citrate lyase family protein [Halorubrum sp. F4]|uniref:HpcH/HpaI aldolase family protein n=1 Tax=Halorubrum sp. F4 TaxID=2989715 RepID=UPI00248161BA|nr:aldolase/citrate lyase family protein [Halorubrum sp. F4]
MPHDSLNESVMNYSTVSPGTFFQSNSPVMVEVLADTPLEFLVLDRQHASPSLDTIENILRAAELHSIPIIVRLASHRSEHVNHFLDAGASGLMIPQVEGEEHVTTVLDRARYARGRSLALGTRAGKFGTRNRDEYVEWVDHELQIIPQIETKAGVDSIEEIVQMDEVESVFVGPGDLGFSLGVSAESEELRQAIFHVLDTAQEAGCGAGVWAPSPDVLEDYEGAASFVTWSSDLGVVASGFREGLENDS